MEKQKKSGGLQAVPIFVLVRILSDKRFQREGDGCFEKVSVGRKGNRAVLQFQKTFCNGKPKSASFRVSGKVSSDEAFQQLVTGNAERGGGNVLENDGAEIILCFNVQINARA